MNARNRIAESGQRGNGAELREGQALGKAWETGVFGEGGEEMRWIAMMLSLVCLTQAAAAQGIKTVSSYRDWTVYEQAREGGKTCWISTPAKFMNGGRPSAEVHLMVSTGVSKGVSHLAATTTDQAVLGARNYQIRFDVVTQPMRREGNYLWLRSLDTNNQLIEMMFARSGSSRNVYVQSTRHTIEFSSNGMTEAFKRMAARCPQG